MQNAQARTAGSATPRQNFLLAALPTVEYRRLETELESITLTPGQVLCEAGDAFEFVYFPTAGIISLVWPTEEGATEELAMIGSDGLIGLPAVLGSQHATYRVLVQSTGHAWRIRSAVVRWIIGHGGELLHRVTQHAQTLVSQIAQLALCHRHHSVDQQLCRWLLQCMDRLPDNQLQATQHAVASRLGVRRADVSKAANRLLAAGLITYVRGQITILDRSGIEACACDCYATLKKDVEHLMQLPPPAIDPRPIHPEPANTRARAEKRLAQQALSAAHDPTDVNRLVHELQVHQIELEMQNEEVAEAWAVAEGERSRYADLYDFSPVAFITLDALGVIRQINLTGAILLGLQRSQITQHRFCESVVPAFRPVFAQFLAEVIKDKGHQVCEIELSSTPQRPVAIVYIQAVTDEDGLECQMVLSNITVQRRMESELKAREQYQRALLDNFPFMVWLKDEQSRFLAVNRPFASRFGWPSPKALVGKNDFDIASPELAEAYRKDDAEVLASGLSRTVEEWIEDQGERRWSETFKAPVILDSRVIGTVGFARDITERKNEEAALRASEQRFRDIARVSADWIWEIDERHRYTYASKGIEELLGYTPDEILGKTPFDLMPEDEARRIAKTFAEIAAAKQTFHNLENIVIGKDGSPHVTLTNGAPILDEHGALHGYRGVDRDVTEHQQMEEQIRLLAFYDSLCKLPNRRLLRDRLSQAMALTTRSGCFGTLMFLDLDNFKPLNDLHGHAVGDDLLIEVAERLKGCVREIDTVARFGGDEFVVIVSELDTDQAASAAQALAIAEKIRLSLAQPYLLKLDQTGEAGRIEHHCSVSIGVTLFRNQNEGQEEILKRADAAMFLAKDAGRNQIGFNVGAGGVIE